MGTKTQEQIARLRAEAEKAAERARKKTAEAAALERRLKTKEAVEERKRETRRKILVGSMQLELAAKDQDTKERILRALDQYLTRDDDRALFNLAARPEETEHGKDQTPG